MRVVAVSLAVAGTLGLAACAVQPPEGPAVAAMPGPGKTYEQFQADNARCQEEAAKAAGPLTPAQAATESGVGSAAAGTVLGAGRWCAARRGGRSGRRRARRLGAGVGLLAGTAAGASAAQQSAAEAQRRYDITYIQCMKAAGNEVPDLTALPGRISGRDLPGI